MLTICSKRKTKIEDMTRDEEFAEFQHQRIEALESRIKELEQMVTALEGHLSDALDQGYQFKV